MLYEIAICDRTCCQPKAFTFLRVTQVRDVEKYAEQTRDYQGGEVGARELVANERFQQKYFEKDIPLVDMRFLVGIGRGEIRLVMDGERCV